MQDYRKEKEVHYIVVLLNPNLYANEVENHLINLSCVKDVKTNWDQLKDVNVKGRVSKIPCMCEWTINT